MSDLIPGLLLYAAAFVVLVGIGLVWDVWRNKEMFDIAARSPLLLCLAGAAHVALVFLQMLAEVGRQCEIVLAKVWFMFSQTYDNSAGCQKAKKYTEYLLVGTIWLQH